MRETRCAVVRKRISRQRQEHSMQQAVLCIIFLSSTITPKKKELDCVVSLQHPNAAEGVKDIDRSDRACYGRHILFLPIRIPSRHS